MDVNNQIFLAFIYIKSFWRLTGFSYMGKGFEGKNWLIYIPGFAI